MRHPPIRQLVNCVHLLGRERNGRRVEPHVGIAVPLHERARVPGIGLDVQDARGVRVQDRVVRDLVVRGKPDDAALAVGPPRSEMTPVKPGTVSRIVSISRITESSERLWMMRPSCSVIEQNVQPPKQPRWIAIEKRIISYAGMLAFP